MQMQGEISLEGRNNQRCFPKGVRFEGQAAIGLAKNKALLEGANERDVGKKERCGVALWEGALRLAVLLALSSTFRLTPL